MNIPATAIDQDGPGIDLTDQPDGVSIQMADPVPDFVYARNMVTLTYDLSGAVTARLSFEAMEFGDEPHAPPPGSFGNDEDFDGVALSVDGVDWYEIQDLRSLRSDRFTGYDLDLNALATDLGLSLGRETGIRFCQYDNNPAPKDGIFLRAIQVTGDLREPILHLPMDDNAANPTVADASAGGQDQTFLDPTGDPNTSAHSVAGVVGTALQFDGVDDQIDLGTDVDGALAADQDFAIAFWWARGDGNHEDHKRIFSKTADNGSLFAFNIYSAGTGNLYTQFNILRSQTPEDRTAITVPGVGYGWNHYVVQRSGDTFQVWMNGALFEENTTAGNDRDFSGPDGFVLGGLGTGYASGSMDEFRVYDRALFASEIAALAEV